MRPSAMHPCAHVAEQRQRHHTWTFVFPSSTTHPASLSTSLHFPAPSSTTKSASALVQPSQLVQERSLRVISRSLQGKPTYALHGSVRPPTTLHSTRVVGAKPDDLSIQACTKTNPLHIHSHQHTPWSSTFPALLPHTPVLVGAGLPSRPLN